jgi:hypothetical protein
VLQKNILMLKLDTTTHQLNPAALDKVLRSVETNGHKNLHKTYSSNGVSAAAELINSADAPQEIDSSRRDPLGYVDISRVVKAGIVGMDESTVLPSRRL